MQPFFNSFQPQLSNQGKSSGSNPQAFPMSMQPQLGVMNPHIPVPFNGSNVNLPNMLTPQQVGILNALNQLGMSQMGQGLVGFPPQNHVSNLSAVPMFLNQVNPFQGQGKGFAPNVPNLPHQFNQNMSLPNFQNPMHGMNPGVSVQMLNHSQGFPFNGPPNSNILANPLFGGGLQINPNQQNGGIPSVNVNASTPLATTTQQVPGNSSTMPQSQNSQSLGFKKQQGSNIKKSRTGASNPNWKQSQGKDFQRNPNRFQKSHNHQRHNGKNKFGSFNEHKGKGQGYEKSAKFGRNNPSQPNETTATKRSLALNYSEQEIKQWREERRKNYPSKANVEKKQAEKLKDSKIIDEEARLRREQLKQILAKQAELGVEVAEIPAQYLLDSEKQLHGRDDDRQSFNKKGNFRNREKRGRHNKNERFFKRQKIAEKDPSNISPLKKRNPTLLQKLLSADIRRDQHRLLQVFRFMVLNSFFKDWPEKPLKFPLVVVKEDGLENEIKDKQLSLSGQDGLESFAGKDGASVTNKMAGESYCDVEDDDDDNDSENNELVAEIEQSTCLTKVKHNLIKDDNGVEEEGEIID